MSCPFCNTKDLSKRIFYCQKNDDNDKHFKYFAFLDATPHTKGHAILAVLSSSKKCPRQLNITTLARLGNALSDVIKALKAHYAPKDILLASLRGDVKHFHIHMIPLYKNEEAEWRKVTGYENGHLMEFIGALEKRGNNSVLRQEANGVKVEQQRANFEKNRKSIEDINKLRKLTGYEGMPNNQIQRMR
jgi:diadenosine tetraphosphate (Ap4A) HIT family hydrolase